MQLDIADQGGDAIVPTAQALDAASALSLRAVTQLLGACVIGGLQDSLIGGDRGSWRYVVGQALLRQLDRNVQLAQRFACCVIVQNFSYVLIIFAGSKCW